MRSCLTSGGWILPPTVPSWPVNWRIWLVYQKFQHSPWVSRVTSVTWAGQLPTNKSHTQWSFSHYCPVGACFCLRLGRGYPTEGRMLFPSFTPNLHQSLREPKFSRKTEVLGCPKSLFGFFCKIVQETKMNFLTNPKDLRCDSRKLHEHQFCLNPYLIFQHIFFLLLAKSRAWLCYWNAISATGLVSASVFAGQYCPHLEGRRYLLP